MGKKALSDKKTSTPRKISEKESCGPLVDRIVDRRNFEPFDQPLIGCRFHRFRVRGESIAGQLGFPIENYRQGMSYPLQLYSGEIVEIVGNRLLHKQIRQGKLCGKRVRIQYLGRLFLKGGHQRKIYRIFEIEHSPIFTKKHWAELITKVEKNGRRKHKNSGLS